MDNEALVTDLEQIKHLAQRHHDDFEVMSYMLELILDVTDAQIDEWVEDIAKPICDAIDCTQCGNCCRSLDVYVTEDDVQQLAEGINVSLDDIMTHIDRDSAHKVKEWGKFKARPCGFLKGTLCGVYAHRPKTCRTYPAFTPDFRWTINDTIEGASICPIIYNVLSIVHQRFDELYDL